MKSLGGEPSPDGMDLHLEVEKCDYVCEPRDQEHARQYGHSPFFQTSAPLQAYHPNFSQLHCQMVR